MGNGCFKSIGHQKSASYQISHGEDHESFIFEELTKKQSQISYPLKLDTLDNFEEGFFQKGFAFIEPVVHYLAEAQTQTITNNIEEQVLKYNDASTQTKIVIQKEFGFREQLITQAPSRQRQSDKIEVRQNRTSHQNTYKTALKQTGNRANERSNRNSQNSLEKQFDFTPPQSKRYLLPNQKNVRFTDCKFSLPVL